MDEGRIEFYKEIEGQAVSVLQRETPKPVIIYYRREGQQALIKAPIHPIPKVVIKVPILFGTQVTKQYRGTIQTK